MAPAGLHAVPCPIVAAPVDVEARVGVDGVLRVAENAGVAAVEPEARVANSVELAVVVLGIAGDQVERVNPRAFEDAAVERRRRPGWDGRELSPHLGQIDLEVVYGAGHAAVSRSRKELPLAGRVGPGSVHQPDHSLLVSVGVDPVGSLVPHPLRGRRIAEQLRAGRGPVPFADRGSLRRVLRRRPLGQNLRRSETKKSRKTKIDCPPPHGRTNGTSPRFSSCPQGIGAGPMPSVLERASELELLPVAPPR